MYKSFINKTQQFITILCHTTASEKLHAMQLSAWIHRTSHFRKHIGNWGGDYVKKNKNIKQHFIVSSAKEIIGFLINVLTMIQILYSWEQSNPQQDLERPDLRLRLMPE